MTTGTDDVTLGDCMSLQVLRIWFTVTEDMTVWNS